MKYSVVIPKPKAKKAVGKVIITYSDGKQDTYLLKSQAIFTFSVANKYVWQRDTINFDGLTFRVEVEFTFGSKKETIELVPAKEL